MHTLEDGIIDKVTDVGYRTRKRFAISSSLKAFLCPLYNLLA